MKMKEKMKERRREGREEKRDDFVEKCLKPKKSDRRIISQ